MDNPSLNVKHHDNAFTCPLAYLYNNLWSTDSGFKVGGEDD